MDVSQPKLEQRKKMNLPNNTAADVYNVLVFARANAQRCDRRIIEIRDLIPFLLGNCQTGSTHCLTTLGVDDLQAVAERIPELTTSRVKKGINVGEGQIPVSSPVVKALRIAFREARNLNSRLCHTGHVLLGILQVVKATDPVAITFSSYGVTPDRIRLAIRTFIYSKFFCYTHFVQAYKIKKNLSEKERACLAKYDNLLAHLLFHRGNDNTDKAEKFLNPNYDEHIHDPFLLKDAEKMAIRFIQAIKNDERIAIYADYDADGIPGAAIFGDLFKKIGYKNYSIYIPHRHDEGFGLNKEAVEQLGQEGVKLLITVDCGITDVDPVIRANELGIDVIITDHHEPPAVLPPAFAIVDHKQNDCPYPDKNLCGSGIAYKLVQAILKIDRLGIKEGHEKWLLDLVGIATLSDMVPLIGENRIFAHYGLAVLRKSPRKGLISLLNKLNIDQRYITEDDIAFMVTPRINAASRMGLPMDAFHLLVADNENDANHYADHLDKINNERKGVVASLVKEVKKIIHERYQVSFPKVLVLGNPLWRPSLLGLVANTCAEEYGRPAFFWGKDGDNTIKGSCRSEGKTNVVELMRAVVPQKTFIQYGGHKHSGGFAISHEEIHYLEQRLNEAFDNIFTLDTIAKADGDNDETSSNQDSVDDSAIDMELTLDEVDRDLFEEVNRLAPFGVGNPKPVFIFRKIIPILVRKFGKGNEHVELTFSKKSAQKIKAISFFGVKEKWLTDLEANKPIDLIASVEKSTFRGANEIRLRVVDIVHI